MGKSLQFWGADKRQFRVSILVAIIGFIVVLILFPPIGFSFDGPPSPYRQMNASRAAFHFVVGLAALFCAINAHRDENNSSEKRVVIVLWCVVLCFLMFLSLVQFVHWWGEIAPVNKPPWMQWF